MIRSILIIIPLFLFCSCAAQRFSESVSKIHVDPSFETRVQEGRHILIYPVIMDTHFISFPSEKELTDPLSNRRDRLDVTWYMDYRISVVDPDQKAALKRLESEIIHERSLDIPGKLGYFNGNEFRFLQIFRVRESYNLLNGTEKKGKHLTLEGEVWDIRKRGVVWRASATVESRDSDAGDKDILLRCIELLYGTLPKFYFNSTEQDW